MSSTVIRQQLVRALPSNTGEVFEFLLKVNRDMNLNVTLRVAGGWVRDMVLNRDNDDIDIAIESPSTDNIVSGVAFAEAIAAVQKKDGQGGGNTVSVIKTNPDQSKHIETAQIKVLGHHLEFCHLRQDDYTDAHEQGHRTPDVKPASPLEDALRRDFTCNALFYNLHTKEVEDYVGGLEDINRGILRCPLCPLQTFLDDPLRMLRGVRFAGQLGFRLDESIHTSLARCTAVPAPFFDPSLVDVSYSQLTAVLWAKVSRERASIELTKCFIGRDPALCHRLFNNLGLLFPCILVEQYMGKPANKGTVPMAAKCHPLVPSVCHFDSMAAELAQREEGGDTNLPTASEMLHRRHASPFVTQSQTLMTNLIGCETTGIEGLVPVERKSNERIVASLYCILLPLFCGETAVRSACFPADKQPDITTRVTAVLCNSMKLPMRVVDAVARLLVAYQKLVSVQSSLVRHMTAANANSVSDKDLRTLCFAAIRGCKPDSPLLLELVFGSLALTCPIFENNVQLSREAALKCINLMRADQTLMKCGSAQPLLRGNELLKYLPIEKTQLAKVLEEELLFMVLFNATTETSSVASSSATSAAAAATPPTEKDIVEHLQSIYGTK